MGSGTHSKIENVLKSLGFEKIRSRHYEHPDCPHLIIEFPPGPVYIGDDFKVVPAEVAVEGQVIKILTPTDCIRDRLASCFHFNAPECLDQAILVAKSQPFDLESIRKWSIAEGAKECFEEFLKRISPSKIIEIAEPKK